MNERWYINYYNYFVTSSGFSNSVYFTKSVHVSSKSGFTTWFNCGADPYDISNYHKYFNWLHLLQKKCAGPWFQLDCGTGLLCFLLVIFAFYFFIVIFLFDCAGRVNWIILLRHNNFGRYQLVIFVIKEELALNRADLNW